MDKPRYEAARFGRKWGIVYRVRPGVSFDQHVRYSTKREAVGMAAALNRAESTTGRGQG